MKGYTLNKYKVLGVITIIIIWTISHIIIKNSIILPSPIETIIAFKNIITSPNFTRTIFTTLSRIIISFLVGLMISLVFGIISALNQWFDDLISPVISLFKTVPTMAIVILALIWLTNKRAPILLAIIMVFPILYEAVIKGIKNIDKNILNMTYVYQVKTIDTIRYIYIPSVLNNIIAIFPSTIGLCLKLVIGGEVLGQPPNSIGTSLQTEKMYLNTAGVLAWIVILIGLSLIIDMMAKIIISSIRIIRKGIKDEHTLR